jgi:acetyltransferase-like isoleucine patch superfamily enzyme
MEPRLAFLMWRKITYKLFLIYYRNLFRPLFGRALEHYLLSEPRVWGQRDRLFIAATAQVNGALFNTISGSIRIKDHVFFGTGVSVLTGTHDYTEFRLGRMRSGPQAGNDIIIEEGVWVASNATVIGPCTIGQDAVVAAGAVVTQDVPPRCIVAGVPARVIKTL